MRKLVLIQHKILFILEKKSVALKENLVKGLAFFFTPQKRKKITIFIKTMLLGR